MTADEITVSNKEMRTTREIARELNPILDALEAGDVEKIVVTSRGKIRGILVSPATFAKLSSA